MKRITKVIICLIVLVAIGLCAVEYSWPGIILLKIEDAFAKRQDDDNTITIKDGDVPLAGPGVTLQADTTVAEQVSHEGGRYENGWLRVEDGRLVNEHDELYQLRGMSSHGLSWYEQYTKRDAIKSTRAYGANMFRIAMYVDLDPGNYNTNGGDKAKNKRAMYAAINNTLRLNMYAVVDWHILNQGNPMDRVDDAVDFFDEVSRRYASEPGVIYEICNEPNGETTSWEDVVEYANRVIPVIRANSPDALIIVGTPDYSSDLSSAMENLLPYENVMYSYHYYSGIAKDAYIAVLGRALEEEFPVFISEWGVGTDGTAIELEEEHAKAFVDYANENGLSWANWSLSNKDESFSAIRADVWKTRDWTYEDLTVSGTIAFMALGM